MVIDSTIYFIIIWYSLEIQLSLFSFSQELPLFKHLDQDFAHAFISIQMFCSLETTLTFVRDSSILCCTIRLSLEPQFCIIVKHQSILQWL